MRNEIAFVFLFLSSCAIGPSNYSNASTKVSNLSENYSKVRHGYHTVVRGDTLNRIAKKYNTSIYKITKENNQSKIKKVFVKVKFSDFRQTTIEHLSTTVNPELILNLTKLAFERHPKSVRLLGLGVRYNQENQQLTFNFNNQE